MSTNEKVVVSLLNNARPALVEGWEAKETGCGELAVRNRALRRYAVLPAEAAGLLTLLDGTRCLNDVAAEVLRTAGRVRHHLILDALARLHVAGLLQPLGEEVDRFLEAQTAPARPRGFLGLVSRLSSIRWSLPGRVGGGEIPPPGGSPHEARTAKWGGALCTTSAALLFLVLYAFSLYPYAQWMLAPASTASVFGAEPGLALLGLLVGIPLALSWAALARGLLLSLLGRSAGGLGLGLTVLAPHLSLDLKDEAMLDSGERKRYRVGALALMALVAAGISAASMICFCPLVFFAGLGFQLVLLADLSPLWPSDFSSLIDEVFGSRKLRRSSGRYLLRKLWRNLVRTELGRQEAVLMFIGSLWLLYLFILVAVLAWLAPGTMDAVTVAVLSPKSSVFEVLVAILAALYLWAALLLFALVILAAMIAGVAQLLAGAKGRGKPFEVQHASTLPLDSLVRELMAVPPFARLPEDLVTQTLSKGRVEKYRLGSAIIRQGEPGEACYVLRAGHCRVEVEDASGTKRRVAVLEPGYLFGEVALLASSPRTGTVIAESEVEVVALDRETFLGLVASGGYAREEVLEQVRIHLFLHEIDLLRGVGPIGMGKLVRSVKLVRVRAGEAIVRAGEAGSSMFVIYKGSCEVLDPGGRGVATLREGDYFGEIALVTGATRSATVRSSVDSILVELAADLYQEVLVKEFSTGVLLDMEVEQRLEALLLA
jgi:CRP-like cAMP-binding protein